jgi:MFS family permease
MSPPDGGQPRLVPLLLNLGHALDHLFLLIFATAVGAIASEFGMAWQDLMPYATGAFVMFGLASVPAGRLGDLWGRRSMMVVFFFGMAASAVLVSLCRSPAALAAALTLMGTFAAIYHPVGIPMLVERSARPGFAIGVNGLVGNLGIAAAAALTGLLTEAWGWRAAFLVPGAVAALCGVAFLIAAPRETEAPARRRYRLEPLARGTAIRVFVAMTGAAVCAGLIFNFTTNGNTQLLLERLDPFTGRPAEIGMLLGLVYAVAAVSQVIVGRLIDRGSLKRLYLAVAAIQPLLFLLAARADGWWLYALMLAFMALVFAQVPFIDSINVRYFDDRVRSRVAGVRLAIAFGVASLAVWALGPLVKTAGFETLMLAMAALAAGTVAMVGLLPATPPAPAAAAPETGRAAVAAKTA